MLGGRWKKKVSYFFLCFMAIVLVWQIREMIWMRKDLSTRREGFSQRK